MKMIFSHWVPTVSLSFKNQQNQQVAIFHILATIVQLLISYMLIL